jgi:Translation initiation factor eIF3 subunit 135
MRVSFDRENTGRLQVCMESAYPCWHTNDKDEPSVQFRPELLCRSSTSVRIYSESTSFSPVPFPSSSVSSYSPSHAHTLVTYLRQVVIPEFAAELDQQATQDPQSLAQLDLCFQMHRRGINLRFLGWMRTACKSSAVRSALLSEMLVRTCKALIDEELHAQLSTSGALVVSSIKKWMVMWLNRIFGRYNVR